MKTQLKLIVLLAAMPFIFLACSKHDGLATTMVNTYTTSIATKYGSLTSGNFVSTGGIKGKGTAIMAVHVTTDSTFCTVWLTSSTWSLTVKEACSRDMSDRTGSWHIVGGTGLYSVAHGGGRLLMKFPPDVPSGVVVIENYTGIVFL